MDLVLPGDRLTSIRVHERGRLYGMRVYLAGPMDRAPDGGAEWRAWITPILQDMGLIVLDPCNKPIMLGSESQENRLIRHEEKKKGNYDFVQQEMKLIRHIDLRMVDMADIVILYVDTEIHSCGSYEECTTANRMKNPVLTVCKQGKMETPDWLFGMFPHQCLFGHFNDSLDYLDHINLDPEREINHLKRWLFFDYSKLVPTW